MSSVIKNMIEYLGVTSESELPILKKESSFRLTELKNKYILSDGNESIEQILKVVSEINILNKKVKKSTEGISIEGQILSGIKLTIEGELNQRVEYVSKLSKTLNVIHLNIPFKTYIVLPKDYILETEINISAYIKDIYTKSIDGTILYNNIIVLFTAEF